jgi:hypothetical protein
VLRVVRVVVPRDGLRARGTVGCEPTEKTKTRQNRPGSAPRTGDTSKHHPDATNITNRTAGVLVCSVECSEILRTDRLVFRPTGHQY